MGCGNIGSLIGGLIANTGNKVLMIGRSPHMVAVQNYGLQIKGILTHKVYPYAAIRIETAEAQFMRLQEKVDTVFITTKAHDTLQAAYDISPYIEPGRRSSILARLGAMFLAHAFCDRAVDIAPEVVA